MTEMQFLLDLVRAYSPSRHEAPAAKVLHAQMQKLGFEHSWIDEAGNAVATNCARNEPIDLLIFGHIDTVPGQLAVREENGKIFGRGAVDAKSPMAALLFGAAKANVDYNVMVAGVVEEEITTSKGIRHLLTYCKPKMAILGEPSNTNGITIAYKGRLVIEGKMHGQSMHSGMREENPIERTFEFYQTLRHAFPQHGTFDSVIMNMTHVHAGTREVLNVVPSELDFDIDVRYAPGTSAHDIEKKVRELMPRNVHITVKEQLDGYGIEVNHPLVRAMVPSMREHGLAPRYVKKSGSADMNITGPAGIPTIAYGPGDSKLDHTDSEVVDIADYKKAIEVAASTMKRLKGELSK
jgi:LysW-gamma-L-lysine carboxypeptidase